MSEIVDVMVVFLPRFFRRLLFRVIDSLRLPPILRDIVDELVAGGEYKKSWGRIMSGPRMNISGLRSKIFRDRRNSSTRISICELGVESELVPLGDDSLAISLGSLIGLEADESSMNLLVGSTVVGAGLKLKDLLRPPLYRLTLSQ